MADFTDVVLFLSSGRTLAWIGAGPSVELGLPTWRRLAAFVLEECRKRRKHNFSRIEEHYRLGKYQDQFDEVTLTYGMAFLHDICKSLVADPGGEGPIYLELAGLNFLSFFTTNYDDLLYRHLEDRGKAVAVYRNSQEDIEAVDIDVTPSLVKLHGDFSEPQSVVLTASDYQNRYQSGEREGFQTFLRSHLARDRILFLGYSLNDPEILALQERLAVNLRRRVAPIALLANASEGDVETWKRRFNIDVVPYPASDSDHSALVSLLKSVSDVLAVGKHAPTRMAEADLRQAQALYMWHRFRPSSAGDAPIDALQSLIMTCLVHCGGKATLHELAIVVRDSTGANVTEDGVDLTSALDRLLEAGWLSRSMETFHILPEGQKLVEQYERRFSNLIEVFTRQLSLDLKKNIDIGEDTAHKFAQVVLDALIDLFELRGRDIMRMVWDNTPIGPRTVTDLLQTLWLRANTLDDADARASLVGFVLDILIHPTGIYENVLDYLAKSYFCIQAMRVDPEVSRHLSQVVEDRSLLIDENVLIPLTAKFEDRHQFVSEAIQAAQDSGLKLCTTRRFVDTVREHANWAQSLIDANGTQSVEVIRAALGVGGYSTNAFLNGFINQDPDDHSRQFLQYLRDCFGGSYTREAFDAYFEDQLNIVILDEARLTAFTQSHSDQHAEAVNLLAQSNQSRPQDGRKSIRRIESEVEALLLISKWSGAQDYTSGLMSSRCSFITSGSSVPWLARTMDIGPGPMMVASVEMLWELLTRLGTAEDNVPSFRSMMTASHFRMADRFIQPDSCRRFFRPLIDTAKKEFDETRGLLEDALSAQLGDRYLDEFHEEEWPGIVSGLRSEAVRRSTQRGKDEERLLEENQRLRTMVEAFEDRERKRREFVARQREGQQRRQGGRNS